MTRADKLFSALCFALFAAVIGLASIRCTPATKQGARTALEVLGRYCGEQLTLQECANVLLDAWPNGPGRLDGGPDGGRP